VEVDEVIEGNDDKYKANAIHSLDTPAPRFGLVIFNTLIILHVSCRFMIDVLINSAVHFFLVEIQNQKSRHNGFQCYPIHHI